MFFLFLPTLPSPAPLLHLQPYYSPWYQTFKFIFRFKNLVDLASILPSYVSYFTAKNTNTNFLRTLRLLRLIRVLRLLKLLTVLKNVDVAIDLILATLTQASLMLSVFLFFVMIIIILFGCLIYVAEQGKEIVTHFSQLLYASL